MKVRTARTYEASLSSEILLASYGPYGFRIKISEVGITEYSCGSFTSN